MYSYGWGIYKMSLDDRTNGLVAETLYSAYKRDVRVRIWYGDIETGHAWLEELDVTGRIGLSMGPIRIPILLHDRRSIGGGGVLDHCIVKIQETKSKRVLYEHDTFGRGHFRIGGEPEYNQAPVPVYHYHTGDSKGWQNVANFKTWDQAVRWVDFMVGRRMTTGGITRKEKAMQLIWVKATDLEDHKGDICHKCRRPTEWQVDDTHEYAERCSFCGWVTYFVQNRKTKGE